jgi:hypothetical protein
MTMGQFMDLEDDWSERATAEVRHFYESHPYPAPLKTLDWLRFRRSDKPLKLAPAQSPDPCTQISEIRPKRFESGVSSMLFSSAIQPAAKPAPSCPAQAPRRVAPPP